MTDNNQKDLIIKIELPETVNRALLPLADSIGNTLSCVWQGTFCGIELWAEKKKIQRDTNLLQFKTDIQNKMVLIDPNNLQEPKMSIIGPAIESSKFFFEEGYYREMFSNLIASASDKSCNSNIHTSFAQIITQLDPNDAIILKKINSHISGIPCVSLKVIEKSTNNFCIAISYVIDLNADSNILDADSLSINNLLRLNLIQIPMGIKLAGTDFYEKAYTTPWLEVFKNLYIKDNNLDSLTFETISQKISFTKYGEMFAKICLK